MSHPPKDAGIQLEQSHGSVRSYVAGFLLSLLFTFIPYYLVVNQIITGAPLLVTILGFAIAQLMVQIIFFLHLGRGPKPNWNLYFFISTVGIILIVVGGSIFIINNLIYNMLPSDQARRLINDQGIAQIEGKETGACDGQYTTHRIDIIDNSPQPLYVYANECDSLLFVNEDGGSRTIVFGQPSDQSIYAGEKSLTFSDRRSNSIILSEPGTYSYYDEANSDVRGYFVVEPAKN